MDLLNFLRGGDIRPNPEYNKTKSAKKKALLPPNIVNTDFNKAADFGTTAGNVLINRGYDLTHFGDPSDYGKYNVNINPVDTKEAIDKQRAKNQAVTEKIGNMLGQASTEIVLGIPIGITDIFDAAMNIGNEDNDYQNAVGQYLTNMKDDIDAKMPIYQQNPETPFDFSDWGWWTNNAVSVVSSIPLMVSGGIYTKGLGLLAKGLRVERGLARVLKAASAAGKGAKVGTHFNPFRATKQIASGANTITTAFMSRVGENYQEARSTYDEIKENTVNELANMSEEERNSFFKRNPELVGKSDEEVASIMAGDGADDVFANDMWLMGFDALQLNAIKKIWKGSKNTATNFALRQKNAQAAAQMAGKEYKPLTGYKKFIDKVKHIDYKNLGEQITEAPEEMWQYATQTRAGQEAKNKLKPDVEIQSFPDLLTDVEALEAGFWGFLGGIGFQGIASGTNKLYTGASDALYKRKHKSEDEGYNMRRAETILDKYREAEIDGRISSISAYRDDMALINQGKDVTNPYLNENNEVMRDEDNNVVYRELDSNSIEAAKKERTNRFISELTINAIDRGNYDLLRDFVQASELGKGFSSAGTMTEAEAKAFDANILSYMDNVANAYEYELGNVAMNAVDQNSIRQIAIYNTHRRLGIQTNNDNITNLQSVYNEVYNKLDNDTRQKVDKLDTSLRATVAAQLLAEADKKIKRNEDDYKSRRITRSDYLTNKESLDRQRIGVQKLVPGAEAAVDSKERETIVTDYIKDNINPKSLDALDGINTNLADAKFKELELEAQNKIWEAQLLNTRKDILETSRYLANLNERFRAEEAKSAIDTFKDILSDESIDPQEVVNYFNDASHNLTEDQVARLREAANKYDMYSYGSAPIYDRISQLAKLEVLRRAGKPEATLNGKPIPKAPEVTTVDNPDPDVTEDTSFTGELPLITPEPQQTTIVTKDGQIIDVETDETLIGKVEKEEAAAVNQGLDQDFEISKKIRADINTAISGKPFSFYNRPINEIVDEVKAELQTTYDVDMINEELRGFDMPLITAIFANLDNPNIDFKIEDVYNIPYVKEAINDVNSNIIFDSYQVGAETYNPKLDEKIEALIDKYATYHNIIGNEQSTYVNLDNIMKFIINNAPTSVDQLMQIYDNLAIYFAKSQGKFKMFYNVPKANVAKIQSLIVETANTRNQNINPDNVNTAATEDKRIQLTYVREGRMSEVGTIKPGEHIEAVIGYAGKTTTVNGVEFYVTRNGKPVQIGFNALPSRTANNDGYVVLGNNINLTITSNGFLYNSPLDDLFHTLFPTVVDPTTFARTNGARNANDQQLYDLILKGMWDFAALSTQELDTIAQHPIVDKLIDDHVLSNVVKGSTASDNIARKLIEGIRPIIEYKISDSNLEMIQSYRNYLVRRYSNYQFTESIVNKLNNNIPLAINVGTINKGEAIEENPTKDFGFIDERVVDYNNGDGNDVGNVQLCYVEDKGVIRFANGNTHMLPGFTREKGTTIITAISNGSSAPTYRAIYPETVGTTSSLATAIKKEVVDIIAKYQTGNYAFEEVSNRLNQIFGVGNLIQDIRCINTNDRILISLSKGDPVITIHKRDKTGVVNKGVSINLDGTVVSSFNFAINELSNAVDKVLNNGRYALSIKLTNNGGLINNNYIRKNNDSMVVTIGGETFTHTNYLDFIVKNKIGKISIGKKRIGGVLTNFRPFGTEQAANQNLQVVVNEAPNNFQNIGNENSISTAAKELINKKSNPTIAGKELIRILAPNFFDKVNSVRIGRATPIMDKYTLALWDSTEDGSLIPNSDELDGSYNLKNKRSFIYRRMIDKLANNPTHAMQADFVRTLIHEKIHHLINNKSLELTDRLKEEVNSIAHELLSALTPDNKEFADFVTSRNLDINVFTNDIKKILRSLDEANNFADNTNDLEEFVVEVMTRPLVMDLMNNLTSKYTIPNTEHTPTLWEKFVDFVRQLFGIGDVKDNSLLDRQIKAFANIFGTVTESATTEQNVENTDNVSTPVEEEHIIDQPDNDSQEQAEKKEKEQSPTKDNTNASQTVEDTVIDIAGLKDYNDVNNLIDMDPSFNLDEDGLNENDIYDYNSSGDNLTSNVVFESGAISVPNINSLRNGLSAGQQAEFDTALAAGGIHLYC